MARSFAGADRQLKMKESVMINKGLIFDGMYFKSFNAKGRYIGTVTAKRRQWLNDHPDDWTKLENIPQEITSPAVEDRPLQRDPISPPSCPIPQKVDEDSGAIRSNEAPLDRAQSAGNSPTAGETLSALELSQIARAELEIAGRHYVSAARLAEILDTSPRTLSRWCAGGNGPPHIKINGVYFERDKIWEWVASRGIIVRRA
jgi:hypothetical protein